MAKLYYENDAPQTSLAVTVLGYGSQGRAQALNLHDSGMNVSVAVREGRSAELARTDGLAVIPLGRATESDVICFLVPDMTQSAVYAEFIAPRLTNQTLMFSHGFCIHYGLIKPPSTCDVVMVAPKSPGRMVRETYLKGFGTPCLVAVHQNASGKALDTALAYARGIGGTRAGVIETTFKEETESDLFGEQAVLCGGVTELVVAGFETLVAAGYQPEVAYFECMHELKLIVDLLHQGGLAEMHRYVSDTAKYGDLTRGPRVVNENVRTELKHILTEIQSGDFSREWVKECQSGQVNYRRLLAEDLAHPIEEVGARLRAMMKGAGT